MKTIYIDDGHGINTLGKRTPVFLTGKHKNSQIRENTFNAAVAAKLDARAKSMGYRTIHTAPEVEDVQLHIRSERANGDYKKQQLNSKQAVFISIHYNAFDGRWGTNKGGVETYHYEGSKNGERLANAIHGQLIQGTSQYDRGVKTARFHVLRETLMPAVLVEAGFMDVEHEARMMIKESFQEEVAEEIMRGVESYFEVIELAGYSILGSATATVEQAKAWALSRGAAQEFIGLANIYWMEAQHSGVNPVVAYAQAAKETGFGRFGGVIDNTYCNPCGLKKTAGGGNYDPAAHKRFISWIEGIKAHMDHLALYAGAMGYPKADTSDPRHFDWIKGKATTVEGLSGNWAPSKTYGNSLINDYIKPMVATVARTNQEEEELESLRSKNKQLEKLLNEAIEILKS